MFVILLYSRTKSVTTRILQTQPNCKNYTECTMHNEKNSLQCYSGFKMPSWTITESNCVRVYLWWTNNNLPFSWAHYRKSYWPNWSISCVSRSYVGHSMTAELRLFVRTLGSFGFLDTQVKQLSAASSSSSSSARSVHASLPYADITCAQS